MTKRALIIISIVLFTLMDASIIKAMVRHHSMLTILDFVIFVILNLAMYATMRWISKI